jgi:hypothetical protein
LSVFTIVRDLCVSRQTRFERVNRIPLVTSSCKFSGFLISAVENCVFFFFAMLRSVSQRTSSDGAQYYTRKEFSTLSYSTSTHVEGKVIRPICICEVVFRCLQVIRIY